MSKGERTLIILSPGFPKDEQDTTCLPFLQQFVLEMNMQFPRLQVVILSLDYPFTRSAYRWNGIQVFSFNGWKKGRIKKLFTWWIVIQKMKKIRQENGVIGILSLWYGPCAFLGSRYAQRNRLKHFCWMQGQDAKKGNRYVSLTKASPGELIAISDFIQSEFEKNYGIRPAFVVPAGIDPAKYKTIYENRPIDILGVGSLIPLKQYSAFIEIIRLVTLFRPEVRAVICGKGPEASTLKKLIDTHHLQDNIELKGELPHAEVLEIMAKSKIFLHTSSFEGICISCLEALGSGCHTLSFVQLMHYTIPHWHILSSEEQMAEKIRDLLSSAATEYNAVQTLTVQESVHKIVHLFN